MTCAAWTNWDHAQGLLLPECLPYVSFGISILSPSLKSLFGSFHPLGSHLWVPCSQNTLLGPNRCPVLLLSPLSKPATRLEPSLWPSSSHSSYSSSDAHFSQALPPPSHPYPKHSYVRLRLQNFCPPSSLRLETPTPQVCQIPWVWLPLTLPNACCSLRSLETSVPSPKAALSAQLLPFPRV